MSYSSTGGSSPSSLAAPFPFSFARFLANRASSLVDKSNAFSPLEK